MLFKGNATIVAVLFLSLLTCETRAERLDQRGQKILDTLSVEANWELIHERKDGLRLYQKDLEDGDLHAIKVSKILVINPASISQIVQEVSRYGEVIKSANTVEFTEVAVLEDGTYGHQYFHIPLMKNRHLVFKMAPTSTTSEGDHWRVDWTLMPRDGDLPEVVKRFVEEVEVERNQPVYMYPGGGTFHIDRVDEGKWELSYRLYIDPAGWLPNWIVERVNRAGLTNLFDDLVEEAKRREEEEKE